MSADEFTGDEFEFAMGSLQGLRAWNMDELGRLHGVTHREVWRPGENVSVCKATKTVPCPETLKPEEPKRLSEEAVKPSRRRDKSVQMCGCGCGATVYEVQNGIRRLSSPTKCGADLTCDGGVHTVPTGHRFDPSCQCGFWAYDEASFTPQGSIVGLIDAYGKTTIGTKGFRAEKARIVALSRRDREDKVLSRSVQFRLASLYPELQFFDDVEALVDAFDGVLKNWADVGEDFWLRPVPQPNGYASGGMLWSPSLTVPSYLRFGGSI